MSFEEGAAFAKEHGLIFLETSAKTAHNVDDVSQISFPYCYVVRICVLVWYTRYNMCIVLRLLTSTVMVKAFVGTAKRILKKVEDGDIDVRDDSQGVKASKI